MAKKKRVKKKAARRTLMTAVVVASALAVLVILALSRVLIVREIMVVGNRNLLREEVITQSGIKVGDRLLGESFTGLEQKLEENRYIIYEGFDFDYKGTLTLRITERLGMAVVYELGFYYVLDDAGMVLENAGSAYPQYVAGPLVTGYNLTEHSRVLVGELLPVRDLRTLEVMQDVLQALEETNMLARTSQLGVEYFDNLFIMTSEGTKVELGENTGLQTKLLIAREVLSIREGKGSLQGAKIDVSNGRNAHYIPAVLPTPTPVPTPTPTIAPASTPRR